MPFYFKQNFIIFFILIAVLGLVAINPFQTLENSSEDTLVIGLQSGYPPFEFMDTEGKIVGFDIDVAQKISDKLKKKLVIKDMDFEGEILSLKQGKIDLIVSGMNITPSRLKEIAMVPYYGEGITSLTLIFWNEIPPGVKNLNDISTLSNPTVSVGLGTVPEIYMSNYPQIKIRSLQGALAPLLDVKYGKSIANLVEPDVAQYLKAKYSQIQLLDVLLSKDEPILGFGIGIRKNNEQLFKQVQLVINELKASGELKKLEDKWFKGVE